MNQNLEEADSNPNTQIDPEEVQSNETNGDNLPSELDSTDTSLLNKFLKWFTCSDGSAFWLDRFVIWLRARSKQYFRTCILLAIVIGIFLSIWNETYTVDLLLSSPTESEETSILDLIRGQLEEWLCKPLSSTPDTEVFNLIKGQVEEWLCRPLHPTPDTQVFNPPQTVIRLVYSLILTWNLYILGKMPQYLTDTMDKLKPLLQFQSEYAEICEHWNNFLNWNCYRFRLYELLGILLIFGAFAVSALSFFPIAPSLILIIGILITTFFVIDRMFSILRALNGLQDSQLKFDLLDKSPLLSIAQLSQRLALSVIFVAALLTYLAIPTWSQVFLSLTDLENNPNVWTNILQPNLSIAILGSLLLIISVYIFISPILWIRERIIQEKGKELSIISKHIRTSINDYTQRLAMKNLTGLGDLKTSIDMLTSFEERYKQISDWPWEGRTVVELIGALFGAVVIPILVSLIQSYLEGLFNIIGS